MPDSVRPAEDRTRRRVTPMIAVDSRGLPAEKPRIAAKARVGRSKIAHRRATLRGLCSLLLLSQGFQPWEVRAILNVSKTQFYRELEAARRSSIDPALGALAEAG